MHIGFTGTQEGMSDKQKEQLRSGLAREAIYSRAEPNFWFHHGDCVGADAEAAKIAEELGYKLFCHPPTNESKRSFVSSDLTAFKRPYLDRNHDIVDACDVLIAAPFGPEVLRSGTWATIRYARKIGKLVVILDRE